MNLTQLATKYNTNEKCIAQLEKVRWGNTPICPHCESDRMSKRTGTIKWHCNNCNKDSTVLYGTIFENSKMPLNKWFQLIFLMINAKMGISAKNISRDLGITYKTAWYSAMRVRCAMLDWGDQLEGIVEMDETYVGGKPRKRNNQQGVTEENVADLSTLYNLDSPKIKRGRGTKKVPVAGIVERNGNVVAKVMDNLTSKELMKMLQRSVNVKNSTLMTDDFTSYKQMDAIIERFVINHSAKEYTRGAIHTNTIEGFWSIIKGGIRGQYRVLSKKYLPFYLAEYCYRYNRRQLTVNESFNEVVEDSVDSEKKFNDYKPIGNVKRIVYPPRRKSAPKKKAKKETTAQLIERAKEIINDAKKTRAKKQKEKTTATKKKLSTKNKK